MADNHGDDDPNATHGIQNAVFNVGWLAGILTGLRRTPGRLRRRLEVILARVSFRAIRDDFDEFVLDSTRPDEDEGLDTPR